MNEPMSKYVRVSFAAAAVLIAFAGWRAASSYATATRFGATRSFTVSAEGKAIAIPNVAQFSFGVVTQGGKDIAAIVKENTDKMNRAIAFVKKSGVGDKDVKTEQYSLSPRYQYSSSCGNRGGICPPPSIVGYEVRQMVQVQVRDFTTVGNILAGVVQSGATDVSGLQFTTDDPSAVQNEAYAQAIVHAREKAQAIARAGGFRLGSVVRVTEVSVRPYYGGYGGAKTMMEAAAPANVPAPSVEAGSQEVIMSAVVEYEIR